MHGRSRRAVARPWGLLRALGGVALLGWLGVQHAGDASAQRKLPPPGADSVTIAAGGRYGAEGLKAKWLGESYRELWTTPIRVPVLDLDEHAGGLEIVGRSGGLQTKGLRLRGADGREYVFRSVDKTPHLTREPALRGTVIADLIQDQTSSLQPAAALVIPPILDAVGILHVNPKLVVMPDSPELGEFREEFGGVFGMVEERPNEPEDGGPGFRGFKRVIGTDRLLERLEEDPEDRVDARAYLTARLVDMYVGDWDRHFDQWRWAQDDRNGVRYWVPIPRDRDYAFVDYDGFGMAVAREFVPNAVNFGPRITQVSGLTMNARELDRRLLASLERATWDSIAGFVQSRLSDEVIAEAVGRLPPEYQGENARVLREHLRSRRQDVPSAAAQLYSMLATEVEVRGTDERDLAVIDRVPREAVEVRLYAMDEQARPQGRPYFERRFTDPETYEVRVYLHGGDDRAVIRGDVEDAIMVRVIGGGGDDVLVDSSTVRGESGEAAFYDDRGENVFVRGPETTVQTRAYDEPERVLTLRGASFRDWGASAGIQPYVNITGTDGLILGGGPTYTRYGFRKTPYAERLAARGAVGLGTGDVAVVVKGDFRRPNSRSGYSFLVEGSELEKIRFYGFGNETTAPEPNRFYVVEQDLLLGEATVNFGLPAAGRLFVGPVVKYVSSKVPAGTPFAAENVYGSNYGQLGGKAEAAFDRRDDPVFPRNGWRAGASVAAYPALWDVPAAFANADVIAAGYWTPRFRGAPTAALRLGAQKVWGDFPIHEAAFLGGSRTLRGLPYQRYAGDAVVYGNSELRLPLSDVELIVRGTLGLVGLADIGRAYYSPESSDEWHSSAGAGLWFRFEVRETVLGLSLVGARAERENRVYLKLGAPF